METLEFVRKARISSASDSELSTWSARLAELIAEQALYAFRMVDSLPGDLRAGHWSGLEEALSALPEYRRISLPPYMLRRRRARVSTSPAVARSQVSTAARRPAPRPVAAPSAACSWSGNQQPGPRCCQALGEALADTVAGAGNQQVFPARRLRSLDRLNQRKWKKRSLIAP